MHCVIQLVTLVIVASIGILAHTSERVRPLVHTYAPKYAVVAVIVAGKGRSVKNKTRLDSNDGDSDGGGGGGSDMQYPYTHRGEQ